MKRPGLAELLRIRSLRVRVAQAEAHRLSQALAQTRTEKASVQADIEEIRDRAPDDGFGSAGSVADGLRKLEWRLSTRSVALDEQIVRAAQDLEAANKRKHAAEKRRDVVDKFAKQAMRKVQARRIAKAEEASAAAALRPNGA